MGMKPRTGKRATKTGKDGKEREKWGMMSSEEMGLQPARADERFDPCILYTTPLPVLLCTLVMVGKR
jgi:hypothetical protein